MDPGDAAKHQQLLLDLRNAKRTYRDHFDSLKEAKPEVSLSKRQLEFGRLTLTVVELPIQVQYSCRIKDQCFQKLVTQFELECKLAWSVGDMVDHRY